MKPTEKETIIVSLREARSKGLPWYFTGKSCCRGHISKRATVNQTCSECVNEKARAKRLKDPEKVRVKEKDRYYKNIDNKIKSMRESRLKHVDARREYDRIRYMQPGRNAWQKDQAKHWAIENKGKRREITRKNKARIKYAAPSWMTAEMRNYIRKIYDLASELGPSYHVDHIHPINGKTQCGLHVPWNLQILPAIDNIKKGNRYVAD